MNRKALPRALAALLSVGGAARAEAPRPPRPVAIPNAKGPEVVPAPTSPAPSVPIPDRSVLVIRDAKESLVAGEEASRAGYTRVSLRDDWTPYIFRESVDPATGAPLANRYRSMYLGLAQDRTDEDGQPLSNGARNYLELYGIPPSFSVLRARFLEDATGEGCKDVDYAKIRAVTSIPSREPKAELKERSRVAGIEHSLEAKRKAAKVPDLASLAVAQPALANDVQLLSKARANRAAFPEVEKRLRCEGMLKPKAHHTAGLFDEAMREALIRFQHKHKLYDAAALKPDTLAALARTPLENDHAALVRVLTERVADAGDLVEDGSVNGKDGPPTFVNAAGQTVPVPNRVDDGVKAAIDQLGLATPEAALAFFQRHAASDFGWLEAGVKLPPAPEYESANMDLSVEIDRGDVIYDPLFDENGKETNQSRHRFPHFTLRVRYRDQVIPLVHWRTTIGGWRSDLAANGYEYYRYKGSDVGPRVWRNVVSGPVWIAPNSTPVRTLVKSKSVNGSSQLVVNYDEVGPGHLSAYGLVAAYNVVPGKDGKPDWDNGVRVHGSSEYLSIRNPNAYSHGCHRLMNHLAVRLFSYVLRHRNVKIIGERPLGFTRQFLWKNDVFELRLPTRGYHYELDPPLPVNVLEGNIVGKTKKPILTYVKKPDIEYPPGPTPIPPDLPESRAGGGE